MMIFLMRQWAWPPRASLMIWGLRTFWAKSYFEIAFGLKLHTSDLLIISKSIIFQIINYTPYCLQFRYLMEKLLSKTYAHILACTPYYLARKVAKYKYFCLYSTPYTQTFKYTYFCIAFLIHWLQSQICPIPQNII